MNWKKTYTYPSSDENSINRSFSIPFSEIKDNNWKNDFRGTI